jgi:hypothetical protein
MYTEDSSIRSCRACGGFFFVLAVVSAIMSCFAFHSKDWWQVLGLVAAALFLGLIGWAAVTNTFSSSRREGGSRGKSEAGLPVPVKPSPKHHLTAAKELPPSDRTHSFQKD